jgi:hypothetical protein
MSRLRSEDDAPAIFGDHVVRSRWNYQVTRRLSTRLIVSAERLLVDRRRSALEPERGLNIDVLVTYFVQPGTALYVGLNSDREGVASKARNQQVFLKMSYGLWR